MTRLFGVLSLALALSTIWAATGVDASGIAVPIQGGRSLGMGFATSTDPQDLTCIYSNPAGLSRLDGTQVYLCTNNGYANVQYTYPGAPMVELEQNVFVLPFVGVSSNFGTDNFAAGIAGYIPFGARMDYPEEGPHRYIIQYVDLATAFVTASAAYNLNDRLSIGAGLTYAYALVELEQTREFLEGLDVDIGLKADTNAFGFNLGVLYDVSDDLTLGLSYTHEITGDLDGDVGVLRPSLVKELFPQRYDVLELEVTMPSYFRLGACWQANPRLKLVGDVFYWRWSVWEENYIALDENPMGITELVFPREWEDSISIVCGAEYTPDGSKWSYRGGLVYDQNAIPDETLDLGPADSEKFGPTLGIGYRFTDKMQANAGFGHIIYQDRTVTNSKIDPSTNGDYAYDMDFLNIDFIWQF